MKTMILSAVTGFSCGVLIVCGCYIATACVLASFFVVAYFLERR